MQPQLSRDETTAEQQPGISPEAVQRWTNILADRAQVPEIFAAISRERCPPSRTKAVAVATAWYRFSSAVGELLTFAASRMDNNDERFTICQIVWEELGSGRPDQIHADMFRRSANKVGITSEEMREIDVAQMRDLPIQYLRDAFQRASSATEVLGLCAGLEQPANENIESVYNSLAYCDAASAALQGDEFFGIHRAIEDTHISMGTTNFLRFCQDDARRDAFLRGFDNAIQFWRVFWRTAAFAAGSRKSDAV